MLEILIATVEELLFQLYGNEKDHVLQRYIEKYTRDRTKTIQNLTADQLTKMRTGLLKVKNQIS